MVRAIIDFNDADYERLRKGAEQRGVPFEQFVAEQAVRATPEVSAEPSDAEPFESIDAWFAWLDSLQLKPSGWKWNREELYDRKVLR